jgi:putative peptide zinc metalloprotease protein
MEKEFDSIEVEEITVNNNKKYKVYNSQLNTVCVLGESEFKILRLFLKGDNIDEIISKNGFLEKEKLSLERYHSKLIDLRIIGSKESDVAVDPYTGKNYGFFHRIYINRILRYKTTPRFNSSIKRLKFLLSNPFIIAYISISIFALLLGFGNYELIANKFLDSLTTKNLIYFYISLFLSGVFHEGAHILACRIHNVEVKETGFALILGIILMAWTTPNQIQWDRLKINDKMFVILIGPLLSLFYSSSLFLLWFFLYKYDFIDSSFLFISTFTLFFGCLLTLIPFINGDGYLLLVELTKLKNLRSNSFKNIFTASTEISGATLIIYRMYAAFSVLFWGGAIFMICYLMNKMLK